MPSQQMAGMAPRVVGSWTLDQPIGSGSFALVWKARHAQSGRPAAVKEINTDKLNKKLQESLASEIDVMKRTSHLNVVGLLDLLKEPGKIFLVLEHCGGGDLAAYLRRYGRLREGPARFLLIQLAEGLKALRANNVIHRDLKPQNLLLSNNTQTAALKIADFGFARNLQPQGLAETLCGSPLYMAPEILQFHRYDAKADLWSVGAILYEMVTGKPPYSGANHLALLQAIERADAVLPPAIAATLSTDCKSLISALLRRNPIERLSFEEFFAHPFVAHDTSQPLPQHLSLDPGQPPCPPSGGHGAVRPLPLRRPQIPQQQHQHQHQGLIGQQQQAPHQQQQQQLAHMQGQAVQMQHLQPAMQVPQGCAGLAARQHPGHEQRMDCIAQAAAGHAQGATTPGSAVQPVTSSSAVQAHEAQGGDAAGPQGQGQAGPGPEHDFIAAARARALRALGAAGHGDDEDGMSGVPLHSPPRSPPPVRPPSVPQRQPSQHTQPSRLVQASSPLQALPYPPQQQQHGTCSTIHCSASSALPGYAPSQAPLRVGSAPGGGGLLPAQLMQYGLHGAHHTGSGRVVHPLADSSSDSGSGSDDDFVVISYPGAGRSPPGTSSNAARSSGASGVKNQTQSKPLSASGVTGGAAAARSLPLSAASHAAGSAVCMAACTAAPSLGSTQTPHPHIPQSIPLAGTGNLNLYPEPSVPEQHHHHLQQQQQQQQQQMLSPYGLTLAAAEGLSPLGAARAVTPPIALAAGADALRVQPGPLQHAFTMGSLPVRSLPAIPAWAPQNPSNIHAHAMAHGSLGAASNHLSGPRAASIATVGMSPKAGSPSFSGPGPAGLSAMHGHMHAVMPGPAGGLAFGTALPIGTSAGGTQVAVPAPGPLSLELMQRVISALLGMLRARCELLDEAEHEDSPMGQPGPRQPQACPTTSGGTPWGGGAAAGAALGHAAYGRSLPDEAAEVLGTLLYCTLLVEAVLPLVPQEGCTAEDTATGMLSTSDRQHARVSPTVATICKANETLGLFDSPLADASSMRATMHDHARALLTLLDEHACGAGLASLLESSSDAGSVHGAAADSGHGQLQVSGSAAAVPAVVYVGPGLVLEAAIWCGRRGAGEELVSHAARAVEHYARAADLLLFLLAAPQQHAVEGAGIGRGDAHGAVQLPSSLLPPLPAADHARLTKYYAAVQLRRAVCTAALQAGRVQLQPAGLPLGRDRAGAAGGGGGGGGATAAALGAGHVCGLSYGASAPIRLPS